MPTSTSALTELTHETNTIVLDAIAANNRRQIAYAKSVWSVVAAPFPSRDVKANLGETMERLERVVDLTMSDLETTSKSTIELAEQIAEQGAKAREESLAAARSFAKTGVSTLKHALETTEERLDTLSKRLDIVDGDDASKKVASAS